MTEPISESSNQRSCCNDQVFPPKHYKKNIRADPCCRLREKRLPLNSDTLQSLQLPKKWRHRAES